jgi:CDP-diacylglycerol--glycerol-3-phosphate 3-phosphatidyltransferase
VNLPNSLTVVRIFLVPLLVVVLLTSRLDGWQLFGMTKEMLGAGIFGIASLTDWLDGYLARRRKQVTGFGQWMDPLADKLLVTAALVSLVQMGLAPAWMVIIILGREFSVTVLRSIAHARGQTLPASPVGKVKMVAQVVAILALILGRGELQAFFVLGQIALWVATIAALVSAVDYSRHLNSILAVRATPPSLPASSTRTQPDAERAPKRVSA